MSPPLTYAVTVTIDGPGGTSKWNFAAVPRDAIMARDAGDLLRCTLEAHERFIENADEAAPAA